MPKGRQTIRKSGGRHTRLWELAGSSIPAVQRLEVVYLDGHGAMDRTEARHAANKADKRLTQDGVRDDLLKFVLNDVVPALHRGRTEIKKARMEVAERRSKLKIEGPDKTDFAAAFRRTEIRARLYDMKPDDQAKYFAEYGDNLPTEIAQAVIELPPEYSRVPKSRHDLLTERALDAQHHDAIAEIKEIEEAIEAAASTVEAARDEVRLEVGIHDPAKFDELAAPIEAKQAAPWLRRREMGGGITEVCVVDLDRMVERIPTSEELATGIIAQTRDEFEQRKAS